MRIISGKYRRRVVLSPPGEGTRPITDRAKVILFDRLEPLLADVNVADVFSGTGSLGLEALSRGARRCVFIEQNRDAYELLKQNLEAIKIGEDGFAWCTDVFRTSFRPQGLDAFLPYDVVFFDPPYRRTLEIQPGSVLSKSLRRLAHASSPGALLVHRCERGAEFRFPDEWQPEQELVVNKMQLNFFRRTAEPAELSTSAPPSVEVPLTEDAPH